MTLAGEPPAIPHPLQSNTSAVAMAHTGPGTLMDEQDPRVKQLQDAAWRLNTLTSKPGAKDLIPEDFKRQLWKVSSRASALCANAAYTEADDFVERAAVLRKEIADKEQELKEVEALETQKRTGNCLKPTGLGTYEVTKKLDPSSRRAPSEAIRWTESAGTTDRGAGAGALTASEVAERCAEDPEALFLCGIGLRDGDMDALCSGLGRAGKDLTSLDLSHNSIADAGVQRLATGFARGLCPQLSELWMAGNPFGELGSQMLKGGLCAMRKGLVVHIDTQDSGGAVLERPTDSPAAPPAPPAPAELAAEPVAGEADAPATAPAGQHRQQQLPAQAAAASPSQIGSVAAACELLPVELLSAAGEVCSGAEAVQARAVVPLPDGVDTVNELDLEVSSSRFMIRKSSDGKLLADQAWPRPVDEDSTQAKFSRRRKTLTLIVTLAAGA